MNHYVQLLLNNLTYVYTLNENRDESMEVVRQFANACSQSTWSKEILNNIVYRCQTYDERACKKTKILSNLQHLDIETVIACLGQETDIKFVEKMMIQDQLYAMFRSALLNEEYEKALDLCGVSQIKDLIMVYNNPSITVAIDELDSGIFEYLLGELLNIISEKGKGQLIFTSHNLRPLETIDKGFIAFTTWYNRFYRFR